jgi:hypothetical protein
MAVCRDTCNLIFLLSSSMVRSLKSIPIVGVQFMSACVSVRSGEREGGMEGGSRRVAEGTGRRMGFGLSRKLLDRAPSLLAQS